jgi:hypothetical protein
LPAPRLMNISALRPQVVKRKFFKINLFQPVFI